VLYFAYGSNMDTTGMRARCPGAQALGPARLPDHRLMFVSDRPAGSSAVPTVTPASGEEVWGVLWDITEADERALDEYEGVALDAYRKEAMPVETGDEARTALVYIATATDQQGPSRRFVDLVVRGAQAHGLPVAYVDRLRAL
jgi:gamma-glutamylcyclotransferase (GGCT)/AIG2-like uncharacterized protein YtfP